MNEPICSNRVFVGRFESKDQILHQMQDAFSWLGRIIKPGDRVFIKPNLTYPFFKPGVTTSPEFMEAAVQVLRDSTSKITFVESDGGAYSWPALTAMEGHKMTELRSRYDVRLLGLSQQPRRLVSTEIDGHRLEIELSAEMLDECDVFITMPVPKVHAMTYLTLAYKNQWGCIPDPKRLRHHHNFDRLILGVNKLLRTQIALFDGTYFLNRTGPMAGDAVPMNLLIASDGIGAGSLVCSELMQIPATKAGHKRLAQRLGMMPSTLQQVTLNTDLEQFRKQPFFLKRTAMHWVSYGMFHSQTLTRILYHSPVAKPAHRILYFFRGAPKDFVPKW